MKKQGSKKLIISETIYFNKLSSDEQNNVLDLLDKPFAGILLGNIKKFFSAYTTNQDINNTIFIIHRNMQREIIGFCCIIFFRKLINGKLSTIVRVIGGMEKEYRRYNITGTSVIKHVLRHRIKYPLSSIYYLGSLIHPSSYLALIKYFGNNIYPTHVKHTPSKVKLLLKDLPALFNLEYINPDNPMIVKVGLSTSDDKDSTNYWRNSIDPNVQFFLKMNPNYYKGEGLLCIAPINTKSILHAAAKVFIKNSIGRRKKSKEKMKERVQQLQ